VVQAVEVRVLSWAPTTLYVVETSRYQGCLVADRWTRPVDSHEITHARGNKTTRL
jgi:hypothetical protein